MLQKDLTGKYDLDGFPIVGVCSYGSMPSVNYSSYCQGKVMKNRYSSLLLVCVLNVSAFAHAGWIDRSGNPMSDEPDRKSIGEYGAWLVLTDKESQAFTNWDTPSEEVYIPSTEKIEKGKTLTALIVFSGCAADDNGNCNLLVKYNVLFPDGSVYADLPIQEAWIDKPVPVKRSLGLSVGYIQVVIEDDEPLGEYTVEATVVDGNMRKSLELKSHFLAVEAEPQQSKALKADPIK